MTSRDARSNLRNALMLQRTGTMPRFFEEDAGRFKVLFPNHSNYSRHYDTFFSSYWSALKEAAGERNAKVSEYLKLQEERDNVLREHSGKPFLERLPAYRHILSPARALKSLSLRTRIRSLGREVDALGKACAYLEDSAPGMDREQLAKRLASLGIPLKKCVLNKDASLVMLGIRKKVPLLSVSVDHDTYKKILKEMNDQGANNRLKADNTHARVFIDRDVEITPGADQWEGRPIVGTNVNVGGKEYLIRHLGLKDVRDLLNWKKDPVEAHYLDAVNTAIELREPSNSKSRAARIDYPLRGKPPSGGKSRY